MTMTEFTFVDTNLFLRYLTNDLPDQADAVERLLVRASQHEEHLITSAMVIAEIVWTLERFYKRERHEIKDKILSMLNTPGLVVEHADLVLQAIVWYEEKNVDYIDAYNAAWMLHHAVDTIYTFDQKHFRRFTGLSAVVPS